MTQRLVIALGGNALQSGKAEPTAEAQLAVVKKTCERIAEISQRGYEIAVVHGNGPQVGRILLASETAKDVTPAMPFDVCGAMSQGYIGYHLQQSLKYALNSRNKNIPVVTLATQMIVEKADPAFQNPTKPIGAFMTKEEADNIARIVGLGALKYFILKVDARKNMTFNPKESIDFNGNTGPFIQYTYARIQSVLRKAKEAGIEIPAQLPAGIELSEKEEGLIQMVADFAAIVKQAGEDYSPSIIANYTYDLVKEYNQFYHDFSILREENEAVKVFRLALSENVAKVVRLGMGLLGIEVPDRM